MCAMHEAAEDVATDLVETHRMLPGCAGERQARSHFGKAVRGPKDSEDGEERMSDEDDRADLEGTGGRPPALGIEPGEPSGGDCCDNAHRLVLKRG